MKKSISALILIVFTAITVRANDNNNPVIKINGNIDQHTISVNGTAEQWITPDEIYLNILIDENDTKGKVSVETLETKMIAQLAAAGIDIEKQLKTENMSNSLENFRRGDSRTRKSYQLLLHDATQVADFYRRMDGIGLSQITISSVTHSKIDEHKESVQAESVRNAKRKASQLAEAIGQSIGKAITINAYSTPSVSGFSSNNVMMLKAARTEDSATGASQPQYDIDFKKIKISASTNVTFILN